MWCSVSGCSRASHGTTCLPDAAGPTTLALAFEYPDGDRPLLVLQHNVKIATPARLGTKRPSRAGGGRRTGKDDAAHRPKSVRLLMGTRRLLPATGYLDQMR
jgi:hypothetical protein